MEQKLFEKFNNLELNDKRNEFNLELIRLFELVNCVSKAKNISVIEESIHNYDSVNDVKMDESEYLSMIYEDLICLRKAIINYFSWKE